MTRQKDWSQNLISDIVKRYGDLKRLGVTPGGILGDGFFWAVVHRQCSGILIDFKFETPKEGNCYNGKGTEEHEFHRSHHALCLCAQLSRPTLKLAP